MDVTFTDDIPKIERQGFERSSKYDELLEACVQNELRAAKMTVDSQGAASSRATSIKNAASSHEAEKNDEGVFVVATRSGDSEDEYHIYTMFAPKGSEEYDEEIESREKRAAAAEKRKASRKANKAKASDEDNTEDTTSKAAPAKPKKKVARKKG